MERCTAHNERFGARGAVTTWKMLCEKKHFVSHESLLSAPLRQAAASLSATGRTERTDIDGVN